MCLVLRSRGDHGRHRAPQRLCAADLEIGFRSAIALVMSLLVGPDATFQWDTNAERESARASPESASAPEASPAAVLQAERIAQSASSLRGVIPNALR
jgi:hypothetical protein